MALPKPRTSLSFPGAVTRPLRACDLPLAHTFPLSASGAGPAKPRHTPSVPFPMTTPSTALGAGLGSGGPGRCGAPRSYGKGVFTSVFCMSVLPPGQLPRVSQQRKALWHLPQQLCQRLGEPRVTCTCRRPAAGSFHPSRSCHGSRESPHAGTGRGRRCSCRSPRGGFSHPDIVNPPFPHGPRCGKHLLPRPFPVRPCPSLGLPRRFS